MLFQHESSRQDDALRETFRCEFFLSHAKPVNEKHVSVWVCALD